MNWIDNKQSAFQACHRQYFFRLMIFDYLKELDD